jgi:hypothetical protein
VGDLILRNWHKEFGIDVMRQKPELKGKILLVEHGMKLLLTRSDDMTRGWDTKKQLIGDY